MRYLHTILFLIFYLLLIQCSDESPTDPPGQTSKGKLVIKSIPPGARIFLMGTDTGKNTPDSLQLDPGIYDFFVYKQYFDTAYFSAKVIENITTTKEITLQDGLPFVDITLNYTIAFGGDSVRFNWVLNQDVFIDSIIITRPINNLPVYLTDKYLLNKQLYVWEDQSGNPIQYFLPLPELASNYYPRIEGFIYEINFYGQKAHGSMTSFHIFFSQDI